MIHMSESQDEKMRKLREEVNLLREQLVRISDQLVEPEITSSPEPVVTPSPEPIVTPSPEPVVTPNQVIQQDEAEPEMEEESEAEESDEFTSKYSHRYRKGGRRPNFNFELGDQLGEYIGGFVEDVMEGVSSELERTLFIEPPHIKPPRVHTHKKTERISPEDAKKIADIMGSLSNEHRVRALSELSWGGQYASDLQEALSEISPSTLSSHLDVLEESGLVIQERRRGRYLITMTGRVAVEMAQQVARRSSSWDNSPDVSGW